MASGQPNEDSLHFSNQGEEWLQRRDFILSEWDATESRVHV